MTRPTTRDGEMLMLCLVKGVERYIFLYTEATKAEALRTPGRWAANGDISFSWYDAAVLSQKIRSEATI